MKIFKNYINGHWQDACSGKTTDIINPANGKIIGKATVSGEEDINSAIDSAKIPSIYQESGEGCLHRTEQTYFLKLPI